MIRARRLTLGQIALIAALIALVALTLLPFLMTMIISQKSNAEIYSHFWALPRHFHPEYFTKAFKYIHFYILNSLIIGALSVAGTLVIASLAGYVFARLEFGGKNTLFLLILALMMVPGILTLVPGYLWYKEFPFIGGNDWLGLGGHGFLNSRWVLVLPYVAGGQVFGIFLCRTFFEGIPGALFEAARIDGASELQTYWRIALPLSLPILATLAIMTFVGTYNDYIWPMLTITDNTLQVFSVGVTKFTTDGYLDEYAPNMAGYLIGSLPLVLVFGCGMKYYVEGLTKGGLKA